VVYGLTAVLLAAAILSPCYEHHQRRFALLLGIPTVLLSLGGHALPGEAGVPVLLAGHLFGASALIVRSLFGAPALSFDGVLGAVCGYLFLGLGWAVLYALAEGFRPEAGRGRRAGPARAGVVPGPPTAGAVV
jgi:hypothetical protein